MRLVVFHYHDRPGGVRQVISCGLPQLVARLGDVEEVVLLLGEVTDPAWTRDLAIGLGGIRLRILTHPEFGYRSALRQVLGEEARAVLEKVLSGPDSLCWAHNLSVGRNLPLLRFLPGCAREAGARLWLHHHDWWWDGRWARWTDWQAAGVHDLEQALEISLPDGPHIHHFCINRADLAWVQQRAGSAAAWVGNPLPDGYDPDKREIESAAAWLRQKSGGRRVWLAPVRGLRRKNLAEAILLARQQSESTCVITTGGPSSPAEVPAWNQLCQASARHRWPFVPAVLALPYGARTSSPLRSPGASPHPSLPALIAAANAIIMPSLQEGFGLPYLEAAALSRPLLSRSLPEVTTNLAALGCTLPGTYNTLPIPPGSFDAGKESTRLAERWAVLRPGLPKELVIHSGTIQPADESDFGCLSLEAQLDVLQSNGRLSLSLPEPAVPRWPAESRVDGWVARFFQDPPVEGQHSGDPLQGTGGQNVRPPQGSLLPEVLRRFRYWQQHPLLWP